MKRFALLFGGMVMATSCWALSVSSGPVVPGIWVSCFADAKEYAEQAACPMIAVYSDPDCGFCRKLDTALGTSAFGEWVAENKIVMVYCKGLGGEGVACRNFTRNTLMAYPYVALYWPKAGEKAVKETFPGRVGYMPSKAGSTLVGQLTSSIEKFIAGWNQVGGGTSAGGGTPGSGGSQTGGGTPVTVQNKYVKTAFTTMMAMMREGAESNGPEGLLTIAAASSGKVVAKFQSASRSGTDSFTLGKWTTASDGVATISGQSRFNRKLTLKLTAAGRLSGSMQDASVAQGMVGAEIDLTKTAFSDYQGDYAVALPSAVSDDAPLGSAGCVALTIKMSSASAAKKGSAKVAVVYPDGKSSSLAVQMSQGTGGIQLPVAKVMGVNLVSAQLAFARPSASAPNVVTAVGNSGASFCHDESKTFSRRIPCAAFGSYLDASQVRSVNKSGWQFAIEGDEVVKSERYGELQSAAWPKKISLAKTGVVKGSVTLGFTGQKNVKGKFQCVYLPGWDGELGVKALGPGWYTERGGASSLRMLTVGVQ